MADGKRVTMTLIFTAAALILSSMFLNWLGEHRAEEHRKELMRELLPGSRIIQKEELNGDTGHVTKVYRGETGYLVETEMPGYVGDILVWTALDDQGTVTGLTIRRMYETWGLGRNALWNEAFLRQFLGTRGYASVGDGIDALTGATVTSKAIAKAVNAASAYVTGVDGITEATEWGDV